MERRGEFRASQLSDQPVGLSRSWTATASPLVSMRMANAQTRFENLAVILQYGVLCCQSFRIKVFGDLVLPGQRRDLFLVLPGRSATSWKFFCCLCSHSLFFSKPRLFLKPRLFELHHHQQSSRGPGLSPVKDWRPLQHGCVQLRSRVPTYLCDSCPPDWASSWRRGSDATCMTSCELAL